MLLKCALANGVGLIMDIKLLRLSKLVLQSSCRTTLYSKEVRGNYGATTIGDR